MGFTLLSLTTVHFALERANQLSRFFREMTDHRQEMNNLAKAVDLLATITKNEARVIEPLKERLRKIDKTARPPADFQYEEKKVLAEKIQEIARLEARPENLESVTEIMKLTDDFIR